MRWLPPLLVMVHLGGPAWGQSVLERSPNIQGVWGLERGHAAFVLAHRFEVLSGGDELFSVPTLTLALGVPFNLTAGVDFTSLSEAIPERVTGNEAQYWLKLPFVPGGTAEAAALIGYNTAAGSAEGALNARLAAGPVDLFTEIRGHSDLFGLGSAGASGTLGAALRINRHLAVTGDIGRVLTEDTVPAAWSAALALEIPGSPHTMSLQIANSGATTLQGAAREKSVGARAVRYGFAFTVPLGDGSRWRRLLRPVPLPAPTDETDAAAIVEIRGNEYTPAEVTIRVGQRVEWRNVDAIGHTVTAEDREWGSALLLEGENYGMTFTVAGRYPYFCLPHPEMRGVVIVTP